VRREGGVVDSEEGGRGLRARVVFDGGPVIREAREERGLSREELALAVERTAVFIALVETGHKVPGAETLAGLCRVLGISIDACFAPKVPA